MNDKEIIKSLCYLIENDLLNNFNEKEKIYFFTQKDKTYNLKINIIEV